MPPTTPVRPPAIRGEVLHRYEVETVADVDRYLVQLKTWLIRSIEQAPERTMVHIGRYTADADRLLDRRVELMTSAT